ncbi:condensin-2 complex subunit G2 [Engraulis encrasicolus]|uniref:condensin-2 complex subunit G2 n=1 Tax=Engraulis encrasicolus TaxID=184585 RepID=UPI002FD33A8E
MSKRDVFIESVCISKTEEFITFIKRHKDASEPFDLSELLQEMQKSQRQTLWAKLAKLLQDVMVACPADSWDAPPPAEQPDQNGMEVDTPLDSKHAIQVIQGVIDVAKASVETIEDGDTYTSLLDCANMLNDVSFLPQAEVVLKGSILQLCECWWTKGLHGKEDLGLNVFQASLTKQVPDIKKLWTVHEALLSVPLDSELGQELTNQLLKCFLNVNFLKRDDGKRFLVFLFSWDLLFIRLIHKTVKNQLQYARKTEVEHLAEMYFRAWNKASGTFLEEIESTCIQDFMQHGIQLYRNSPVLPKVRQILNYFHKQKLRQGVDAMLYRLYRPILWRALKVPNGEVRANATLLFAEAFPLNDPDMDVAAADEALQRQLDTLVSLLDDQQPMVRSTAVLGTCAVLGKCWQFIPNNIIGDLLKKLVQQLAQDTSSPDVRCAVFMSMSVILDNNLTHSVMENILPLLKLSLHDTSEKVRVAFVDLLLKIKAVRAAKFWKVCSMEHLLARLERDSPSVSKRIVDLLFSSFFPVNQPVSAWVERCITLVQMNPRAARKFYYFAHMYTTHNNLGKLMLGIRMCLNSSIRKALNEEAEDGASANKENSTSEEGDMLSASDRATMARLLELVVILWRSIRKSLDGNKDIRDYLTSKFASALPEYMRFFQDDHDCTIALMQMASLLPAAALPTLSCGVLSRLKKLEVGSSVSLYSQILDCMCSWGRASHVLEVVTDWLTEALEKAADKEDSTARRVRIQDSSEAKPDLGLNFLDYLLTNPPTREATLNVDPDKLKQLLKALRDFSRTELYSCVNAFEPPARAKTTETAVKAFMLHSRLLIHLHNKHGQGRELLEELEQSAIWVKESIMPFLVPSDTISTQQAKLAHRLVETCVTMLRDVITVGAGDMEFKGQALRVCAVVLCSEKGYLCMAALLSLLSSLAKDCMSQNAPGQEEERREKEVRSLVDAVANIFHKSLQVVSLKLRQEPEEGKEVCASIRLALMDFLGVMQQLASVRSEALNDVFSSLFAGVLVEISHALFKVSHVEQLSTPESSSDLPPLSSYIMDVLLKCPPAVTRSLFTVVQQSLDTNQIDNLHALAAVTHILLVVRQTGQFKADVKNMTVSVKRLMDTYASDCVEAAEEGDKEITRTLYTATIKTVDEILMP